MLRTLVSGVGLTGVKRRAALLAVVAATLMAAACGGSSSSDSDKATGTTSSSELDAAKALVEKYSAEPTTLPISEPITKPIPSGLTVEFITCGATGTCTVLGNVMQEAADILGWTVKTVSTDNTPSGLQAAFNQALRDKPDVLAYVNADPSLWSSLVPQFKANGTFIAGYAGIKTDFADYNVGYPEQNAPIRDLQAAAFAVMSQGKGSAVFVSFPAQPSQKSGWSEFSAAVKKYCSGCSADHLDLPTSDFGPNGTTKVVAYLRAHPDVKWVIPLVDATLPGLPAAIKAAGLSGVTIGGQGGTVESLQNIQTGSQTFELPAAIKEPMFAIIDAAARHFAGEPAATYETPHWVVTKDNLPEADENGVIPLVTDLDSQFKTLWGK